jgi:hypothetical protein
VLAVRILVVAALVPLLMRLRLSTVTAVVEPRRRRELDADAELLVHQIDRVLRRGRPLTRPGCLTRGVTRLYFLRRAGVDVRLVFGVGEAAGAARGHCWLVRDGEPYLEPTDPRPVFREIASIPAGSTV